MNMCQQGRKYHTSLAMSATDDLFVCCERARNVHVYEVHQWKRAFCVRVGNNSVSLCVFSSDSWLILLVTHTVPW